MDAGIASTILFVYPVMVAVIMFLFFHEKISLLTVFCILMALSGIGMLYKGDSGETLSLIGMLLVILSSLSYAIYIVGVNHSTLKTMSTAKLTFYALLFGLSIYVVRLNFMTDLQAFLLFRHGSIYWQWLFCLPLFHLFVRLSRYIASVLPLLPSWEHWNPSPLSFSV